MPWQKGIDQARTLLEDSSSPAPNPCTPKCAKRASDREKTRGRHYQLIARYPATGQVAGLDTRHRSPVHIEADIKQAKAIGLNRCVVGF